ncbi:UNVERIFIED_CONTAM: hypothetical protein K2H54_061269, partial [Gekko kuhli]
MTSACEEAACTAHPQSPSVFPVVDCAGGRKKDPASDRGRVGREAPPPEPRQRPARLAEAPPGPAAAKTPTTTTTTAGSAGGLGTE